MLDLNPLRKFRGFRPTIPEGMRVYAIGDIHGRLDLLERLLQRVEADVATHPAAQVLLVFLGDYIDRGDWSRETIDRLIALGEQRECRFLKGNHESVALSCLSDRRMIDAWLELGGRETLLSYGIEAPATLDAKQIASLQMDFYSALPQTHLRFFSQLKVSFTCGDFFFAHAGARPRVDLARQSERDLLWIRGQFLRSVYDFGKIVVHGHTPTSQIEIRPNRINIDTGAFATGLLSCLVLEREQVAAIDTAAAG
jgi:serine/threonine protein phosphatase 1